MLDTTDQNSRTEALTLGEEPFQSIFDYAAIGMALVALDGRWLRVNRALCRLLGFSEEEFLKTNFQAITHPEDLDADLKLVNQLLAGEVDTYQIEKRYFSKTGLVVWSLLSVSLVRDLQDAPLYFISQIQDITDRKRSEQALRASQEQYKQMVEYASDIIYQTALDGRFTFVNPTIIKILKYTEEEFLNLHYFDVVRRDFRQITKRFYARQIIKKTPNTYYEFIAIAKDGTEVWLGQHVRLLSKDDQVTGFQAVARDVTKGKRTEEELRNLSLTDDLTGLYNRRGFLTVAEHQLKLARNKRIEKKLLVIYVDLDGLKQINDAFGHEEGSRAIIKTAEILKRSFRQSDLVARLGGDEFVVLAIEADEESTELIVSRLFENLKNYNAQGNHPYKLSFSIGVARFDPEIEFKIDELIRRADQAMYSQKRSKQIK